MNSPYLTCGSWTARSSAARRPSTGARTSERAPTLAAGSLVVRLRCDSSPSSATTTSCTASSRLPEIVLEPLKRRQQAAQRLGLLAHASELGADRAQLVERLQKPLRQAPAARAVPSARANSTGRGFMRGHGWDSKPRIGCLAVRRPCAGRARASGGTLEAARTPASWSWRPRPQRPVESMLAPATSAGSMHRDAGRSVRGKRIPSSGG